MLSLLYRCDMSIFRQCQRRNAVSASPNGGQCPPPMPLAECDTWRLSALPPGQIWHKHSAGVIFDKLIGQRSIFVKKSLASRHNVPKILLLQDSVPRCAKVQVWSPDNPGGTTLMEVPVWDSDQIHLAPYHVTQQCQGLIILQSATTWSEKR
jgi:hypothetical protein